MDKRKSFLNVTVSIVFNILTMVTAVLVKRTLILSCGNEVNGLNALFLSIVGFLSIAELGIGSAISFSMYKPIVDGDTAYVSALYRLFQRIYLIIGGLILAVGLAITPFIHYFAKDYQQLDVNLYITFILMLISVVVTYWYGPKTSLINAYKSNYITTTVTSCGTLLQSFLQIAVLLLTNSFVWYLVCRIVSVLAQGLVIHFIARKRHRDVLTCKASTTILNRKEITKNIKAMFMHKVGTLLVNTSDSIIISTFLGVNALGLYSNYNTILTSVTTLIALVFSSLTSVLGHLYAESGKETTKRYCDMFHLVNFALGAVVYLGYYAIIDNLIALLFAEHLVVSKTVVFVITYNAFVQFMRRSVLVFRDATGTFYHDRWKPLIEGLVNVILSILFVKWIGVAGVIVATVITSLLICHIIEPHVLYKHAFSTSPVRYYLINYGMMGLFFIALLALDFCMIDLHSQWLNLLVNGCIAVGLSLAICLPVLAFNKTLRQTLHSLRKGGK